MISLFPLRPIHIVDISFQLLRKKFIKSFGIALSISLPLQSILWVLEASQPSDANIKGRLILIIAITQFFVVGASLTLASNVLSKTTGGVYCKSIFYDLYNIHKSPSRIAVAIYHIGLQILFAATLITIRFLLGHVTTEGIADGTTAVIALAAIFPWIFVTLRLGFAVPIAVHEGGTFSSIRKRTKQINKVHFFKLFGVYCTCIFMILVLVFPSLIIIEVILAKNFITSNVGQLALTNIIVALVIASVSAVYGYILTVTYFNARIEYEGFDIAIAIQQSEIEEGEHGKLFNSVA